MKKFNVVALANTFGFIDLILHPLFHIWGWYFPRSYENVMKKFVIGLNLNVAEQFTPTFFVYWIIEVIVFWFLGLSVGYIYNKLSNDR